jgi:iron complex outermembrane receptor protein
MMTVDQFVRFACLGWRLRPAFIVAATALMASGVAAAQGGQGANPSQGQATAEAPESSSLLSEIVVTAEKRPELLQQVPASVSVVTSEEIAQSNALTVEGLLNQVPGLSFHKGDIPFNQGLFLRGVGTNSFALGAEPSVAYVVDGVVMGTSGEAFSDLLDIARIEVIPGPQGTLFGKNSSAGAINVVSTMPGTSYAADVEVGYFEGDETRTKASVDLPITDQILTRTTVFTGKYAGNLTNLYEPTQGSGPTPINGYDHQGARTIWKFLPTDSLTFTLIGDWRQARDNCCTWVNSPPGTFPGTAAAVVAGAARLFSGLDFKGLDTREVDQSLVTQSLQRERGFSLQMDWDFNRYTLTDIVSYRYWWFNEIRDGDFEPATAAYVGQNFEQVHDVGPQTTSTFTNELRLASPTGGVFEYVLGLYYYHTVENRYFERDDVICTASPLTAVSAGLVPCLPGISTYVDPSANATLGAHIENEAAFGQGTIRIADPFRAVVGARATHDSIEVYHNYNAAAEAGGGVIAVTCSPEPTCPFEGAGSTHHSNVSGKAGLEWDILKSEMLYFTYSRGYKGPAYNVYFNQTIAQAAPLPPETSIAYESGLKSSFLNGDAYLNFALFHEAFNNFQANSPVFLNGVGVTTLADAGQAATQGFELTGAARLTSAWSLNGGLAYANAHVTNFTAVAGADPRTIAPPGSPLPFAPRLKYNIATDYRWSGQLPFDLIAHTDFDHTSDWWNDFASCTASYCAHGGENPFLRLPGYGIWNASLGASDRGQKLTLTFLVKNLLDTHYASLAATGGPGGAVQYFIPRDADRYWGLQLDYKMGN